MSNKVLSNSSSLMNEYTYKILNNLSLKVKITRNDFQISPTALFQMAARINKKRSFLFVSKVLGKHLPVNPITSILVSSLLASKYMKEILHIEDEQFTLKRNGFLESITQFGSNIEIKPYKLPQSTIFIGFAETATALGHGVFDNFQNAFFFHTTREKIENKESIIHFEEEHSHATSHYCYIERNQIENQNPIVFIDDELTTGNTILNIIHAIQSEFPRKSYTVLTLLDWRNEESIDQFRRLESNMGIEIHIVSLISGEIEVDCKDEKMKKETYQHQSDKFGKIVPIDLSDINTSTSPYYHNSSASNYLWQTGRFGLYSSENEEFTQYIHSIAQKLVPFRSGGKTLCLGNGELMYLPMKIAALMGKEVYFQSTTRSPIFVYRNEDYLIQSKYTFPSPEDHSIQNYFYQIEPHLYSEVFVFFERELVEGNMAPLLSQLASLFQYVYVVTLSTRKDDVIHANGPQ
ncbi:phosphoribosyltransferase domain-containing protein [Bacillus sp. APMAM]|nr:phosphoribosyltransferase domain-containing protein [Bacillus sp. APMAM]RTZ56909.1 adenine/guanine phosphoribosyltransferase [Bacillus sp. SAJ1]